MLSVEAEYNASAVTVMGSSYFRYLEYDADVTQLNNNFSEEQLNHSLVLLNNSEAIDISESDKIYSKTCHIERRYHYVRQKTMRNKNDCHLSPIMTS